MSLRAGAFLAALVISVFACPPVTVAEIAAGPSPVVIVVDTSGSMGEGDGSPSGLIKIDGAKVALLDFLQQVEPETPIGLRTYPGGGEGSEGCNSGAAQFEVSRRDPVDMAATIRTLRPGGNTPTAAALEAAGEELRETGAAQATLVLVSDGESNCGPPPCEVAEDLAVSGIDLQTITIGFRISGAGAKELQCIADQTGGKYLSVHDNAGLADAFDEISRPQLRLTVEYPPEVTAEVGNDPTGLVRIEAEIANDGRRLARGGVTRIRFDAAAGAPAVTRPVVFLGNLEPGESRKVSWTFRPGVPLGKRSYTVPFTILAGAENTLRDAEFEAGIRVRDAYYSAGDAGPILSARRRIAIVGDSFSAGEGANLYLPQTDTDANTCHRSPYTYLARVFDLPDENILACSGAVTYDIHFPQMNGVPSQIDQLTKLRDGGGVEAVVMTLGGNDAGFGKIVMNCLIGKKQCSEWIYTDVPAPQLHREPARAFVGKRLGELSGSLSAAYRQINWVVNGTEARDRGSKPVPILVLAYPLPTPLTPMECPEMHERLSAAEIDFLRELALELNGVVEGAVAEARGEGMSVFFVPNTEMAFQPDHTVCHAGAYARTTTSFDFGGNAVEDVRDPGRSFWDEIGESGAVRVIQRRFGEAGARIRRVKRGFQELVHPNQAGYAAMTRAVLRWSRSPDAEEAEEFLESSPAAKPSTVTIEASDQDLGQLAPGEMPTLQGGTVHPLTLQGFAPGSTVTIGVHSEFRLLSEVTASGTGTVTTKVGIPPELEAGDHTLTVAGAGADGEERVIEIPFRIDGGGPPPAVVVLGAAGAAGAALTALLAAALAFGSWRRGRRRNR